jgi:branched-chain amino acid aminotransferase
MHCNIVFFNGDFINAGDAKVSCNDRGFKFGDGVFETIYFQNGNLFNIRYHIKRLHSALSAIKIKFSTIEFLSDDANIEFKLKKLINLNQVSNGIVRIAISRGEGSVGYLPVNANKSTVFIEILKGRELPLAPASIMLSTYKKIPKACLPVNVKLSQGLNSTLALLEAKENECEESLMLNIDNYISECSSSNIFWRKGEVIKTPSSACDILEGSVRDYILQRFKVEEGEYFIDELQDADEVFVTSVGRIVQKVKEIKGFRVYPDNKEDISMAIYRNIIKKLKK